MRVLTGLAAAAITLLATFYAPADLFFVGCVATVIVVTWEFSRLARDVVPGAPIGVLFLLVPVAAALVWVVFRLEIEGNAGLWVIAAWLGVTTVGAAAVLFGRTPMREALATMGIFAFAVPYLAVPTVSLAWLKLHDAWLLLILFTIVWLGDIAAYYIGSWIGRHKMAPVLSPNKSWEGAVAGLLASVGGVAVWCWLRFDQIDTGLLVLAAVTAVAGQQGDLVESAIKRSAGRKDSSQLMPGHGGVFDRVDALLIAAPVFTIGLWWLGIERYVSGGS
ncbi:MAG: phosphatidate cytidylyltransferase [Acidobacteriota bacterium]